jgi:hypothetical protein
MIRPDDVDAASDKVARNCPLLRTVQCVVLALLAGGAYSQAPARGDDDPLHSAECQSALLALERRLQEAAAGSATARQGLAAAREKAKEACLGRQAGGAERSGAPASPIALPAPAAAAPQPRATAPETTAPPPPVHIPRPVAITTCDPGGCWDSEGRRLNFMGPVLISPQGGVCTVQGGAVQCPQ